MKKFLRSNRTKWIAVSIAGILMSVGIVGLAVKVSDMEATKTLGSSAYSIGLLDDTTGKLPSENVDKGGLRTTKFYKYEGLKCEIESDSTIEYQVNFYDEDKKFLAVQTLQDDFDSSNIPTEASTAKYVKIEIIPTEDDDGEVGILEKSGYVEQLKVTVTK